MIRLHFITTACPLLLVLPLLLGSSNTLADRVRTLDDSLEGKILTTSREAIDLDTGEEIKKIEIPQIIGVLFENEPSELAQARINLANGGYRTALDRLKNSQLPQMASDAMQDDFAFIQAESMARLAINKQADAREAGRQIVAYQKKYPSSFHYYETVITLGDLLKSIGRYDRAIKQYDLLRKAPWPGYQAKAAYLSGLVRQEAGDQAAAVGLFDESLAAKGEGTPFEIQQLNARLAKAISMLELNQIDKSLQEIRSIILSADSDQEIGQYALAAGYNALGNFYLKQGKTTDALLAFLRVDYLYEQSRPIHAESLYHLVSLWNRYGEPEAAKLAKVKLRNLYADSRWAAKTK